MSWFRRRTHTQQRLERERPTPDVELRAMLTQRIVESRPRVTAPSRRARIAAAAMAVSIGVVAAGITGGLSYAQGALTTAKDSVASSVERTFSADSPTTSSNPQSVIIASSISQYQGAGYYCTRLDGSGGNGGYSEQYISSQTQYNTVDATHEIHRYDGATPQPCNSNNH